jgi:hypothetical protein
MVIGLLPKAGGPILAGQVAEARKSIARQVGGSWRRTGCRAPWPSVAWSARRTMLEPGAGATGDGQGEALALEQLILQAWSPPQLLGFSKDTN